MRSSEFNLVLNAVILWTDQPFVRNDTGCITYDNFPSSDKKN